MAQVELRAIVRQFGSVRAVDAVDLHVRDNEFMVLLGPSGCGKTTTLRCVAGLERVDAGRVLIGGRDVTDLPPGKRHIGMVFQSYAIFPHMTVAGNIGFGLRLKGEEKTVIERKVREVARLLQLESLLDRYPGQLSGGQRQRVAVARAVVIEPQVLLMDEPLSNLDALLRLSTRAEIKRLHAEIRATTLYVTHDQVEALSLGDRIAVMKDGRIAQCDTPQTIYDLPADTFVGGFIGNPPMNFLRGHCREDAGSLQIVGEGFTVRAEPEAAHLLRQNGEREVIVGIRPEHVAALSAAAPDAVGPARVVVNELLGAQRLLTLDLAGQPIKVTTPADAPRQPGELLWLRFDPAKLRFFSPDHGRRIAPA